MISSNRPATHLKCPGAEVIAAFVDGRLSDEERAQVIQHLNECEDCYDLVVEASRFSEEEEEAGAAGSGGGWRRGWGSKAAGLTGLAAAALLVFGFALGWFDAWIAPSPQDWVASLPRLPQDDPLMQRASPILERVGRSAAPGREVHLAGIQGMEFTPAIAGPDDTVFAFEEPLRAILGGSDPSEAEAIAAFVFGHEISHLLRGETGHAFAAQLHYQHLDLSQEQLRRLEREYSDVRRREDRADKEGLFFAFMAGYDVPRSMLRESRELGEEGAADNLFVLLSDDALAELRYPTHASPRERAAAMAAYVQGIVEQLEVLHAANRLYQAGRFQDAASFLESLRDEFPLPEVSNNLGAAHFQLAAEDLARCNRVLARRYLLPVIVDYRSIEQGNSPRGGDVDPCYQRPDFLAQVRAARNAFQQALDQDPQRLSTRINRMSLALLDANESGLGLIPDEDSVNGQGQPSAAAMMLAALLRFEYKLDMDPAVSQESLEELRQLRRNYPLYAPLAYNLASALEQAGSAHGRLQWIQEASQHWQAFLDLKSRGPFADHARQQVGLAVEGSGSPPAGRIPPPPVPLTEDGARQIAALELQRLPLPLAESGTTMMLYRSPTLRMLQFGSGLLWLEESVDENLDEQAVRSLYGEPLDVLPTSAGSFLRYRGFGADIVHDRLEARVWFASD
ncbi:MAG TPA: zf-HC2 domain-containing protein [Acidobacteriota bacterium]|nr:zf-HC2 domain-containing protein [Acidobacteriota bacterium]